MNKFKNEWLTVAEAFDTEPAQRTAFQLEIASNGLCYAITSATGQDCSRDIASCNFILRWMRANGIMADYIGLDTNDDEPYDRRRVDFIRRDVAILFATLTENELLAQAEASEART